MSDTDPKPETMSGSDEAGKPKATRGGGFLSTATGKVVAIVVGLGTLALVAGLAVAIVLYATGDQNASDDSKSGVVTTSGSAEATGAAGSTTATAKEPAKAVTNAAVFTFRDIFDPLIEPLPSQETSDNETTTTPTSHGTLYLQNIVTEGGTLKAVLLLNGTTYKLAANGVIPNTPWKVLRVTQTSVTMLYGDVQVVLTIGQGVTK